MTAAAHDFRMGLGPCCLVFFDDDNEAVMLFEHTASANTLIVNGSGVEIGGDLTVGSSRELKTAFSDVDSAEVLDRVRELNLQSWEFKTDPAQAKHVGPIAEEFHAAFGLGIDDKHVSPGDTAGVALIAIQELAARVEALASENKRLQEEVSRLQAVAHRRIVPATYVPF